MTAGEEVPEEWMVEEMLAELDGGPLTFSLPMFPSYKTKSKKLDVSNSYLFCSPRLISLLLFTYSYF